MTLIELLVTVLVLGLGVVGTWIGRVFGGAPGALAGLALGLLSLPALAALAGAIESRFFRGSNRGPACLCGSRELRSEWTANGGTVHRCGCGEAYVRDAGRVFRKTPAGALRPYVRWHWRRGWSAEGLKPSRLDAPYR